MYGLFFGNLSISRSRVRWTEEGGRSTKFFFGLEMSLGKKAINNIISLNRRDFFEQHDISNKIVDFHQNLYKLTILNSII